MQRTLARVYPHSSHARVPRLMRPEATEHVARDGDSGEHFYMNKLLNEYIRQKPTPITLRQLVFYERHVNTDRILKSANYVRRELPIRIAHRIHQFQKLPFIVGTNPHIQQVYELYWQAFERLRKIPEITSLDDNYKLCQALTESLDSHLVVIPHLVLGIFESEHRMEPDRIDKFMNATLCSRISRRVLAEQHLTLSRYPILSTGLSGAMRTRRTTVFSSCSARDTVAKCSALVKAHHAQWCSHGTWPLVECEGDDAWFTYVSDQIEYIIYQLLSNAVQHSLKTNPISPPPVKVTVCSNANDVLFRVSDQAGGIIADVFNHVWSYSRRSDATFGNLRHVPHLAAKVNDHGQLNVPLGIGLPMSRVYAEYWGGDINLMTLDGWGTDAYVRVPRLGTQNENIIVDPFDEDGDIK